MPGSLKRLTVVADDIRSTRGKLEKIRKLAAFFRELDDDDLDRAAIHFTGNAFAPGTGRAVQAGLPGVRR